MTRCQQLRLDRAWTIKRLADEAGVPVSSVYRLERGKGISVDRLAALARVLEVRPSELLRAAVFESGEAA